MILHAGRTGLWTLLSRPLPAVSPFLVRGLSTSSSSIGKDLSSDEVFVSKLYPELSWIVHYGEDLGSFGKKWKPLTKGVDTRIPTFQATWDPDTEALLLATVRETGLDDAAVEQVIEDCRTGLIPDSPELLDRRIRFLQQQERNVPGLSASSILSQDAIILNSERATVSSSMSSFQDAYPSVDVGPLMTRISRYVVEAPTQLALRLRLLKKLFRESLATQLPLDALSKHCVFLRWHVTGLVRPLNTYLQILGRDQVVAMLSAEPAVLAVPPSRFLKRAERWAALWGRDAADVCELLVRCPGLVLLGDTVARARLAGLQQMMKGLQDEEVLRAVLAAPSLLLQPHATSLQRFNAIAEALALAPDDVAVMVQDCPLLLALPTDTLLQHIAALLGSASPTVEGQLGVGRRLHPRLRQQVVRQPQLLLQVPDAPLLHV